LPAVCRPRHRDGHSFFSGEAEAARIVQEAFDLELGGVKLHAPVRCFAMAAATMVPICEACQTARFAV
jgi:hypothetical protein